jgi:hypothetical protein
MAAKEKGRLAEPEEGMGVAAIFSKGEVCRNMCKSPTGTGSHRLDQPNALSGISHLIVDHFYLLLSSTANPRILTIRGIATIIS